MARKADDRQLSHGLELFFGDIRQRVYRDQNRRWRIKTFVPKKVKVKVKRRVG